RFRRRGLRPDHVQRVGHRRDPALGHRVPAQGTVRGRFRPRAVLGPDHAQGPAAAGGRRDDAGDHLADGHRTEGLRTRLHDRLRRSR
ncbi:hypothetical protein KR215_005645, partial [Drosophila sulfurigaster]